MLFGFHCVLLRIQISIKDVLLLGTYCFDSLELGLWSWTLSMFLLCQNKIFLLLLLLVLVGCIFLLVAGMLLTMFFLCVLVYYKIRKTALELLLNLLLLVVSCFEIGNT